MKITQILLSYSYKVKIRRKQNDGKLVSSSKTRKECAKIDFSRKFMSRLSKQMDSRRVLNAKKGHILNERNSVT